MVLNIITNRVISESSVLAKRPTKASLLGDATLGTWHVAVSETLSLCLREFLF